MGHRPQGLPVHHCHHLKLKLLRSSLLLLLLLLLLLPSLMQSQPRLLWCCMQQELHGLIDYSLLARSYQGKRLSGRLHLPLHWHRQMTAEGFSLKLRWQQLPFQLQL